MKDEELIYAEIDRCKDFEYFAKEYLKIKTESGDIIPFILNSAQKRFYEKVKKSLKKKGKAWYVICKPRQLGFSTIIQGIIYHYNFMNFNQKFLTMGHKSSASSNLLDIYKRFYDKMPIPMQPVKLNSNELKLKFKDRESENKVDTASAGEVGHSDTYQGVHLTEYSRYPDPKLTYTGLAQCSKYAKYFFIESTANGFNDFRTKFIDALEGNSDFEAFFISWLEFPPYKKQFDSIDDKDRFLAELGKDVIYNDYANEELILRDKYNATLEQLHWRRWVIDNTCEKDVRIFHQEYPAYWQEAFLSSGQPVFNVEICERNRLDSTEPVQQGNLVPIYNTASEDYQKCVLQGKTSYYDLLPYLIDIKFEHSKIGYIKLFDDIKFESKEFNEYNIFAGGADVSEGLEQSDKSVIKVLDRRTNRVILTWSGLIDYDLFANEIHKIQVLLKHKWYINIEAKVHGVAVIADCFKLGVNMYFREDFNKGFPEAKDAYGTKTSGGYVSDNSKNLLISDLNKAIRENAFIDRDIKFWNECLTFVKDARGRMGAENKLTDPGVKCYDDAVMAQAMMWRCHLWMSPYRKEHIVNYNLVSYPHMHKNNRKLHDNSLKF